MARPATAQLVELGITWHGVPTALPAASYAVMVYEVMAFPPVALSASGVTVTVACPLPRTADAAPGAAGTPAGVIGEEVAAVDVPAELVAVALNV